MTLDEHIRQIVREELKRRPMPADFRRKKDWSAAELAERSGVALPTIYSVEKGRGKFARAETVTKIAAALGVEYGEYEAAVEYAIEQRRAS